MAAASFPHSAQAGGGLHQANGSHAGIHFLWQLFPNQSVGGVTVHQREEQQDNKDFSLHISCLLQKIENILHFISNSDIFCKKRKNKVGINAVFFDEETNPVLQSILSDFGTREAQSSRASERKEKKRKEKICEEDFLECQPIFRLWKADFQAFSFQIIWNFICLQSVSKETATGSEEPIHRPIGFSFAVPLCSSNTDGRLLQFHSAFVHLKFCAFRNSWVFRSSTKPFAKKSASFCFIFD